MGESFGRYKLGDDAAVMPFITSANIACGLHAGDPLVMRSTIRLAKQCGVAIGAHPGWPDLQGFGRRNMALTAGEVEAFVLYQIGALAALAKTEGARLTHVKAHGALYNQAAKDVALAAAIASAVKGWDDELIVVGLAGSAMITAGLEKDLRVASEAFPDRQYNTDGTLVSRAESNAVLESAEEIASNAVRLAKEGIDVSGRRVQVDTLCLHGDNPSAIDNARLVHEALEQAGIQVRAM
jgi:UPF0271 protein